MFDFSSLEVREGRPLDLSSAAQRVAHKGNFGLENGYLLTVNGDCEGWTLCRGAQGYRTVRLLTCFFGKQVPMMLMGNADLMARHPPVVQRYLHPRCG